MLSFEDMAGRIREAFPDRGESHVRALDRWLWLGDAPDESGDCSACGRRNPEAVHLFDTESRIDGVTAIPVCAACLVLMREALDVPPDDERVLADLRRVLPESQLVHLERFMRAAPAPVRGQDRCDVCVADESPRIGIRDVLLCSACLQDGVSALRRSIRPGVAGVERRILSRL